ncbi:hypothetical protein HDEF_0390 [Candidatus Hamiltonella defensa 5AT (Acyrthosiphon pisum)]|uniref:Uncharacterized protein n=1 Tax=Hamiltonella defensa subsp. Acyrthosiphon pisum (strain 5AT) TaxID=572265 RepID=C4K3K3_HAMD5|nr:hypothetical protein HDEF_0390 [Candidatus Hamiltonella defensa 5AT (Acyrthosiphon pisum)]
MLVGILPGALSFFIIETDLIHFVFYSIHAD